MAKPDKIMKQCPTCKGKGKFPADIAKFLPKGKDKCTFCKGKGFVFEKPKK